ncbi:hypothetical protein FACS189432_02340 [Bacteroidia bacterium]|nr:hypothetical protein FACS189426_23240 [Bacteroidia bacterium]GHT26929.1 hypothetical protein FACS189432_02340 [Bacteroidia bacterium]GHV70695.1 hypothetical protein FACS189420_2880 [Bacteroidia bacterium]
MKKIIICTYVILASFGIFLSSCEAPEAEIYTPEKTQVSFQIQQLALNLTDDDGTVLKIALNRSDTKGSYEVPITFTSNSTLFTMSSASISFKDGEGIAYAEIAHPLASELSATATYSLKVKYDSELKSPSGIDSVMISAKRQLTWVKVGGGIFSSEWFEDEWEQDLQRAVEAPTLYRLPACYYTGYDMLFTLNADNSISYETQQFGYNHSSYGMASWRMPRAQYQDYGEPRKEGNVFLFLPEITVSAGTFGQAWEEFELK